MKKLFAGIMLGEITGIAGTLLLLKASKEMELISIHFNQQKYDELKEEIKKDSCYPCFEEKKKEALSNKANIAPQK